MFKYLKDGRCNLHNNDNEQMTKSYVTSRKNWIFTDSIKGANALAIFYNMAEITKVK